MFVQAMPSFRSLWLFSMSVLSFSPDCWSCSWAFHAILRPFITRLLINALKRSWMPCDIHGMWFRKGDHSIPQTSSVFCSSWVMERFYEALSVVNPNKRPSVRLKFSSTSFKCMACLAPVWWPLTYYPQLAWVIGKEVVINIIESELHFTQWPILIPIGSNNRFSGQCICSSAPI